MNSLALRPPQTWKILLALGLVYTSWGTTYLAISEGVKTLPPCLFGGVRLTLAGCVLLAYLVARKQFVLLRGWELAGAAVVGILLFVFGNGLLTIAEMSVPSGIASVLVATTPLWIALLETAWPWGERLTLRGWLGLLAGTLGVVLLCWNKPAGENAASPFDYALALASASAWALGSVVARYRRGDSSPFVLATHQLIIGGLCLTAVGLAAGEVGQLGPQSFTPGGVFAFFYLLVFGSLVGFLAYAWLLANVSTTLAGTYAYVNPVVALIAGAILAREPIGWAVVCGMGVILLGVALVRQGAVVKTTLPALSRSGAIANQLSHELIDSRKSGATLAQPD